MCSLCIAPDFENRDPAAHRAYQCSAKYGHPQALKTGGACAPVQRSDQTATAQPMPSEIITAPSDGNIVSSATVVLVEKPLIFLNSECIPLIPLKRNG